MLCGIVENDREKLIQPPSSFSSTSFPSHLDLHLSSVMISTRLTNSTVRSLSDGDDVGAQRFPG
jgi:hypothetical protein